MSHEAYTCQAKFDVWISHCWTQVIPYICCCCCCYQVGHAGTLDPAATGLLIICTGAGTKSIEGFMAAHKEYSGTLKLGEGTPSLDAETAVEERLPWDHISGAHCFLWRRCVLSSMV
jgi:hypothetical protein